MKGPFYEQHPVRWYIYQRTRWKVRRYVKVRDHWIYDPDYDGKHPKSSLQLPLIGLAKSPVDFVKELYRGKLVKRRPRIRGRQAMVLHYGRFGPQVFACELIGFEWYQWNASGHPDPGHIDDIRLSRYKATDCQELRPIIPENILPRGLIPGRDFYLFMGDTMSKTDSTHPRDASVIWSGLPLRVISVEADEPFLGEDKGGVILHPPLRDRRRTELKVLHAHGNDASRALDIVRAGVLVRTVDEFYSILSLIDEKSSALGWEIVGFRDRVKDPTPNGYRDLLLHLRLESGFIVAIQIQVLPILAAKVRVHPLYVEAQRIRTRARARREHAVLVCDLFNYQLEEEEFLVEGFPAPDRAREFARRWVRDSVEEFRGRRRMPDEHRLLWTFFGEDAVVIEAEYAGSEELDFFLSHPDSPSERDWAALVPNRFGEVHSNRD
jgi:hypothetical protein